MKEPLVRKALVRIVCDTYTCQNLADYEVGHIAQRALCMHYCQECMEKIVQDARELFGDFERTVNLPENDTTVYDIEEDEKEETKSEEEEIPVEEEEAPVPDDFYICKYCGERFKRPDELSPYRAHVLKCARES